jgi:beta-lactamase superfamily II metal-dependent hydrolase
MPKINRVRKRTNAYGYYDDDPGSDGGAEGLPAERDDFDENAMDELDLDLTFTATTGQFFDPSYANMNRRGSKQAEQKRQKASRERARVKAEELRAAMAVDRGVPDAEPGERGDGYFHMASIKMGQGDCTIMSTPEGKVILIDCGTNSHDDEAADDYNERVRGELQHPAFLGNTKVIDIVILTHADKDHYSELGTMLPSGYTAHSIYHSGELGHYTLGGARWCRKRVLKSSLIKQVVLNLDGDRIGGETTLNGRHIDPIFPQDRIDRLDASGGLLIVSEPGFAITLLAAGVEHDYAADSDGADHKNRGSIVTLVEVGRDAPYKVLISGDATRSTEAFLLKNATRKARLSKVDYLQAGHHGSQTTSSSPAWIAHTQPQQAVFVSAGRVGHRAHRLPSWSVIDSWDAAFEEVNGRNPDAAYHVVMAWNDDDPVNAQPYKSYQPVYSTGSNGSFRIGANQE